MTTKQKFIIIPLTGLITLGIVIFIILPTIRDIKRLNNSIYKQRVALEKLYLRGQSIRKSHRDYNKIKDQIKILDNIFNRRGEELKFITSLEKIAQAQNIEQIIDIKDDNKKNKQAANYQTMRVELKLIGTFPKIITYLDQIQTMDYYFNIDHLKFYNPHAEPFEQIGNFKIPKKTFKKSDLNPEINAYISGVTYWK